MTTAYFEYPFAFEIIGMVANIVKEVEGAFPEFESALVVAWKDVVGVGVERVGVVGIT